MYILGISAYYHDSAAVLIKDGQVVSAIEEERFSRVKHDNRFPFQAIEFCLENSNITINNIDYIAYYEKSLLKFERILENFTLTYPFSYKLFLKGLPEWLDYKIKVEHTIKKKLKYAGQVFFIPHHFSHASASYYTSPFREAAILTIDGVGEYQTTGLWKANGQSITSLKVINFPNSLGLLYSTFTAFLGFRVNEDEYKVMGLAAYGIPKHIDKIHKLIEVKNDGSFQLNMNYFAFRESLAMWNKPFEVLFGKSRNPEEKIFRRHKDLAASIQKVIEEIYFKILNYLYSLTKSPNLCISGGVALNALANGKIYSHTPFKNIYILGAAGDNGAALGSAMFTYRFLLKQNNKSSINNLYLGSEYDNKQIEERLKKHNMHYKKFKNEDELIKKTAYFLSKNKIIGWFQGKMEFGPRALGSRSILANPKPKFMKEKVNRIKIREQFRPFAGSVLQEKVHEYFQVPEKYHNSPFMVFCFQVRKEKRNELSAIVHQDGSCRVQTVSQENGRYYKLIKEFYALTTTPCLLNTSFNLKGEPIVENPEQAIKDFLKTELDYLVIGDFLAFKNNIDFV